MRYTCSTRKKFFPRKHIWGKKSGAVHKAGVHVHSRAKSTWKLGWSRNVSLYMTLECLLPYSQEPPPPSSRSYADKPDFITRTPILILYCDQRVSFTCSFLTSEYSNKFMRFLNFHLCYMPRQSHTPSFHRPNTTQYMFLKLTRVLHASPIPYTFIS